MSALPKKSTNVRFSPSSAGLPAVLGLATLALAGCSSAGGLRVAESRCPPERILVCESFAGERQCECAMRRGLRDQFGGFGPAAPSFFGP